MCDAEGALQPPDTIRPGEVSFVGVPLDDDRDDDWTMDDPEFHVPRTAAQGAAQAGGSRGPGWRQALAAIAARSRAEGEPLDTLAGQILYVIDLAASTQAMALVLHLLRQEQKQNGDWGLPKPARIASGRMEALPEPDRVILGRLAGARPVHDWAWSGSAEVPSTFHLRGVVATDLLPVICRTARCRL